MKKFVWLVALLSILAFSVSVSAANCNTAAAATPTWSYGFCQNVTILNTDTKNGLEAGSNPVILLGSNGAAGSTRIATGKSTASGADVIVSYGSVELARFNETDFTNGNPVSLVVQLQKNITAGGSDSNYILWYGAQGNEVLQSRTYNASKVFTYFGDDFDGSTYNASGLWGQTSGAFSSYCANGGCTFGNSNGTSWNIFGWNKTQGAAGDFNTTNATSMFRARNESAGFAVSATSLSGGVCQTTDLATCGGIVEPFWGFQENASGYGFLAFGDNTAPTTNLALNLTGQATPFGFDVRLGTTVNVQQFWRGSTGSNNATQINDQNPANKTLAVTAWHPAFGVGGSTNQVNFTVYWVGVRKLTVLDEPKSTGGTEFANPAPYVQIYAPTNITYYNTTNQTVTFSVNSTQNATNMSAFVRVNGVSTFIGTVLNASVNTFTIGGIANGGVNLSVMVFDSVSGLNGSGTDYYTQTNGLNISAFNASQGVSTYLTVDSVNVSNSTNSSTTYSVTTPFVIDTKLIPNGVNVNVVVNKSGYATQNISILSNASALYTVNVPLWRYQEFKALSNNGSSITTFSFTINSGSNITSYSTTNGSVYVSLGDIPIGSFVGSYAVTGYNSTNVTFTANTSSEINFTATLQAAGLQIFVYDEASCASTCQRIYLGYTATNGTNTTSNFSVQYFVNETWNTFPQGVVTFTFNNTVNGTYQPRSYLLTISPSIAQVLNVYLLNQTITTISAAYCVQTFAGAPIPGASITIQRSIAGSYVTVAQGTGGSSGCYTFILDSLITYQVIASATGYSTYTAQAQPVSNQIIRLSSGTAQVGFQTAYADQLDLVQTQMNPKGGSVSGDWVLVNFTIYSYNATLTNWGMSCYYNGTTIYNTNITTSPSGGGTTSNITLTNKTGYFYCTGLFDRTGYNTTFVNKTYYVNIFNTTFLNTSLYNILNTTANQNWSPQVKFGLTALVTFGITAWAGAVIGGVATGLIAVAVVSIFAMLNFMPMNWLVFYTIVTFAWAWFVSRLY